MDVITYCARKITRSDIPKQILEDAFLGSSRRMRRTPDTIESRFRDEIMLGIIREDINAAGGVRQVIPLNSVPYQKLENYQRIYKIPTKLTSGRTITQAHVVTLNLLSNSSEMLPNTVSGVYYRSTIDNNLQRMVNNNMSIPNRANAEVEILSNNVLKINDWQNFQTDLTLDCLLSYSENLSEIRDPYFPVFAKLSNLATKAYCYRELSLLVDKTRLEGGREFGRYREFLDEYRDAQQQYDEYLDSEIYKVLILNDQGRKQKHIQNSGKLVF